MTPEQILQAAINYEAAWSEHRRSGTPDSFRPLVGVAHQHLLDTVRSYMQSSGRTDNPDQLFGEFDISF